MVTAQNQNAIGPSSASYVEVTTAGIYGGADFQQPKVEINTASSQDIGKAIDFYVKPADWPVFLKAGPSGAAFDSKIHALDINVNPDSTPPSVSSVCPANGSSNIEADAEIFAIFNECISSGANFDEITIKNAAGAQVNNVAGSILDDMTGISISHNALATSNTYTVTIPAGAVEDYWGNNNTETLTWSFSTPGTSTSGGGGGGGGGVIDTSASNPGQTIVTINLMGSSAGLSINADGIVEQTITATSSDGKMSITIPAGTAAKGSDGKPLSFLSGTVNNSPPASPDGKFILSAFNFEPSGATFDPPISFTYRFNPDDIPEGVNEANMALAYYDTQAGTWIVLEGMVDTESDTITVPISHFTTFAIMQAPAPEFSLSDLTINPAQATAGETVNISVTVNNNGDKNGTYKAVLNINGKQEEEKAPAVATGSSQIVIFEMTFQQPGNYQVSIGTLNGSFSVVAPLAETSPTSPPSASVAQIQSAPDSFHHNPGRRMSQHKQTPQLTTGH